MYRSTLENQWRSLCADFAQEYQRLSLRGDVPRPFDDWYGTRIRRWGSAGYAEGLILQQLDNGDFSRELQGAMAEFHFTRVDAAPAKPVWVGPAIGAGVGLAAGVILALLKWGAVKSVITGVVLCGVIAISLMKKAEADHRVDQERVRNGYKGQLEAHLQKLMAVCDRYRVE